MKKWLSELTPSAAIASFVLSGAAWAGASDDFGCSNATLKGEYAFGVTVYTPAGPPFPPPSTVVVTGIKVFDGHGNLTQRDYQGDNLAGPDFAPRGQETGTYQVNSDCTGSMVINLNVPNVPSGLSSGVIEIKFVISGGGRHIHEVVSQLTPPLSSGPVPTQTSADDWKVASEQDQQDSLALIGAVGADDFGCSNATLNGEYAFGVTDYTPAPPPNPPPATAVITGIAIFDGQGHYTQRDYAGDNLNGDDFAPKGQETGTYQVNSDCTASGVINLNVPNVPAGLSSGVIKTNS